MPTSSVTTEVFVEKSSKAPYVPVQPVFTESCVSCWDRVSRTDVLSCYHFVTCDLVGSETHIYEDRFK